MTLDLKYNYIPIFPKINVVHYCHKNAVLTVVEIGQRTILKNLG